MAASAKRIPGQRIAIAMMLALLVGCVVVAISLEFVQSAHYGYGSGFSRHGYVPAEVLRRAHLPAGTPAAVVAQRTNKVAGGGLWHDGWRLALWALFLVAIVSVYVFMIGHLGAI